MSYFIKGNDKKSSVPSECKVTVTSVNTNTANCEPEFSNDVIQNVTAWWVVSAQNLAIGDRVRSYFTAEGNSKKSEDDDFSWVSSQDFLVVGGEEK